MCMFICSGALIYAKWKTDDYFYAGHIVRPMTDNRFVVDLEGGEGSFA